MSDEEEKPGYNYFEGLVESVLSTIVDSYKYARKDGTDRDDFDPWEIAWQELNDHNYVIYTHKARQVIAQGNFDFSSLEDDDIVGLRESGWSFLACKAGEEGVRDRLESALDTADEELEAEHDKFHAEQAQRRAENPNFDANTGECPFADCDRKAAEDSDDESGEEEAETAEA